MRLHIVTIVLDGMPWVAAQMASLNRIKGIDWTWHISHGVAANTNCTSWCKKVRARLSNDGTTEFLHGINASDVKLYERSLWPHGKVQMVNAGCKDWEVGDIVLQMDSDEIWTARQIELMCYMLEESRWNAMLFRCRYFVGPRLVTAGDNCYGNHTEYEWRRAWKVDRKDFRFTRHEPPEVAHELSTASHETTGGLGLVFDHYAYATKKQVEFKERYYGYDGAVEQWEKLQQASLFPVRLKDYLKWVTDDTMVVKL